jgi:hypothetical protein
MHGSSAGKTMHGKISPLKKLTRSESSASFSVLPNQIPQIPLTSRLLKVRVIDVQRPSV